MDGISEEDYQDHPVFYELEQYAEFYALLSDSVFGFFSTGTRAIGNIDSWVYSSIQGTLESIRHILKAGRINDAYALLRKYFDSVIINVYSSLYLQDHVSIENFIVEKIDDWLKGKQRLPNNRVMMRYIGESKRLSGINAQLHKDDRYKRIRNRCNDHTHYNLFYHVLLNYQELDLDTRRKILGTFSSDVRDVFILHLAYIFSLNDHYMTSSDHVDALECGVTPEPDSQYWVASFIQEVFDNIIRKRRPDIAATIKRDTCMQLS